MKKPYPHEKKKIYPHKGVGIPRSLYNSDLWRKRIPHPIKGYYFYLLGFSDMNTFKPVWPSRDLIMEETGLNKDTLIKYNAELVKHKLLKIYAPRKKDIYGVMHFSRSYHFPIHKWINLDYIEINAKAGEEIFPLVVDYFALEAHFDKSMTALKSTLEKKIAVQNRKIEHMNKLLDSAARRIKIDSVDEKGVVHLRLFSNTIDPDFVREGFNNSPNILIHPAAQDFEFNPGQNWYMLQRSVRSKLSTVKEKRNVEDLIHFLENIEA